MHLQFHNTSTIGHAAMPPYVDPDPTDARLNRRRRRHRGGRGRRERLQPREQPAVDEVRAVVVRAVPHALQHVERHVGELRRQPREELPHGPVDRGEGVPVAPQHQHGQLAQPPHQRDRARTRRARHRRHERVQGALRVGRSADDLRGECVYIFLEKDDSDRNSSVVTPFIDLWIFFIFSTKTCQPFLQGKTCQPWDSARCQ